MRDGPNFFLNHFLEIFGSLKKGYVLGCELRDCADLEDSIEDEQEVKLRFNLMGITCE